MCVKRPKFKFIVVFPFIRHNAIIMVSYKYIDNMYHVSVDLGNQHLIAIERNLISRALMKSDQIDKWCYFLSLEKKNPKKQRVLRLRNVSIHWFINFRKEKRNRFGSMQLKRYKKCRSNSEPCSVTTTCVSIVNGEVLFKSTLLSFNGVNK